MGFLRDLFGKKPDISGIVTDDDAFLQAEPISRKRMDLLWLDPPRLAQLQQPLAQHNVITITIGDSSNLRDHDITQEDFEWAKQVEQIVDKAFASGQRGNHKESIRHYKQALLLAPGCDLFLMSIGASYAQLGQKGKAIQYLGRAAQISPGNSRIRDNFNNAQRM
jgi:tetratricopeptide (TPR) repeat protein